jgi:hypothetical protein
MIIKITLSIALYLSAFYCTAATLNHTVSSVGIADTEEQAIDDALQKALEKTLGVLIYSKSEVKNNRLISDKIVRITKGFITDYQVNHVQKFNNQTRVSVTATIDATKIQDAIRSKSKDATLWQDTIKKATLIKSTQTRLKAYKELLEILVQDVLADGYDVDLLGLELDDIGVDYVTANWLVQINVNQTFWQTYLQISDTSPSKSKIIE